MPSILLVDNVSSHLNYDTLVKIESPRGFHIYHVPGTHIYLLLGLPKRSHMLNSGDKLVNRSLRAHCRQRANLRLLRHCMHIVDGKIPPRTPLDMSEGTIKHVLTLWVSHWPRDPQLPSWVKASWRKALDVVPEAESVDDVPPAPSVIYVPPPPLQCCRMTHVRKPQRNSLRGLPREWLFMRPGSPLKSANVRDSLRLGWHWRGGRGKEQKLLSQPLLLFLSLVVRQHHAEVTVTVTVTVIVTVTEIVSAPVAVAVAVTVTVTLLPLSTNQRPQLMPRFSLQPRQLLVLL